MQRINSPNARPDQNGTGKQGFHDNTDLNGQDATYLTPQWCNTIQEELANLLEKHGISLDGNNNAQLYDLLVTNQDFIDLSEEIEKRLQQLKANQEQGDSDLQTQLLDSLEQLQKQISQLNKSLASSYPKIVQAGVTTMKSYAEWTQISKPAGTNINYLDLRYAIMLCPEGSTDIYRIERKDDYFRLFVNVAESTVGSAFKNKRVSWQVIQTEGLSTETGNGDYGYVGSEVVFPILAGESKSFLIIAGGGGGGSSRYADLSAGTLSILKAENGETSYIKIDNTDSVFTVTGGIGGTGGVDDGNQFINGDAGLGGQWQVTGNFVSATRTNGQAANQQIGTHSDSSSRGSGGNGANGYQTQDKGYGGGAGEGARLSIIYKNDSTETQYARLYVGKGGYAENSLKGQEKYQIGTSGQDGFIRVSNTT